MLGGGIKIKSIVLFVERGEDMVEVGDRMERRELNWMVLVVVTCCDPQQHVHFSVENPSFSLWQRL